MANQLNGVWMRMAASTSNIIVLLWYISYCFDLVDMCKSTISNPSTLDSRLYCPSAAIPLDNRGQKCYRPPVTVSSSSFHQSLTSGQTTLTDLTWTLSILGQVLVHPATNSCSQHLCRWIVPLGSHQYRYLLFPVHVSSWIGWSSQHFPFVPTKINTISRLASFYLCSCVFGVSLITAA